MPGFIIPQRVLPPPQFNGPIAMNRDSWQANRLNFWQAGLSGINLAIRHVGTPTGMHVNVDEFGFAPSYPADGAQRYTVYADRAEYQFTTDLTIAAWTWTGGIPYIGVGGSTNWYGEVVRKNGNYFLRRTEDSGETNIGTNAPRWSAIYFDGTNVRQLTASVVPVAYTTQHVVMVVANNDIDSVYVNGVKTTTPRTWFASGRTLTNTLEIGGALGALNETFGDLLWDVRIYSYAMADGQVRMLYDPPTRWDLYAASRPSRVFFDIGAAVVRRFLLVR